MTFYLLYDENDQSNPYGLLTPDGRFSRWESIRHLLTIPITDYEIINNIDIKKYLANPDYPIIATFDHQPTAETNPELLL